MRRFGKGAGHRVQRAALDGGGQGQGVSPGKAGAGVDQLDARGAGGEGAGLVEQHHVAAGQGFQRVTAVDDDAAARQAAQRGQQGGGGSQRQCAWAGDDEDGGGDPGGAFRVDEPPDDAGDQGHQQHADEEGARIAVGGAQHGGAAGGGALDQAVQLGQPGIGGTVGDFHDQRVAQIEAARDDQHARATRLGLGFAGEQ